MENFGKVNYAAKLILEELSDGSIHEGYIIQVILEKAKHMKITWEELYHAELCLKVHRFIEGDNESTIITREGSCLFRFYKTL